MPDVHLPIFGNVPRGGVIAGAVVGIGGIAYFYIKHKAASSNTTTASNTASGFGYGYNASGYGYNNPAFNEPYIGGEYGYGGAYGYGIGEGYGVGTPYAPTQVATTNAAWAQAAENYLTTTGGYDPGTVAAALGLYITGTGTLTTAQQSVVEAAIAFEGYPPDPGPNGYPPAMHTSAPGGQGGGGGSTGAATVAVPGVAGQSADQALTTVRGAGFKAVTVPFRNPKNEYIATGTKPAAGTQARKGSLITVSVKVSKKG
jgi:hypothetical protein